MQATLELARRVAERLGRIEGVVAVALGGSWARGVAQSDSDVDLGIYYRAERPLSVPELRALATELDDRRAPDAVSEIGEWGPWINGGAWLAISGRRVDWLYRELAQVERTIEDCRAGRIRCDYQPGHPHGFHNHTYAGETDCCIPLFDPERVLPQLKALTAEYPQALKRALIDKYLWEASFALETSQKTAGRGDVFHVAGGLFRSVACLVQVLFAVNERYFVNEKGALALAGSFPIRVPHFERTATDVLAHPGADAAQLMGSISRVAALVGEVARLERVATVPSAR